MDRDQAFHGWAAVLLAGFAAIGLAGCGKQEAVREVVPEAVCGDGGKVLNIYCWNTEFEERMTDYYPGYTDHGDGTGSIGDVKVIWTVEPTDDFAYQNAVDEALLLNMDAPSDEKIDLFLMEADYILKYVESDYTLDIVHDLGLSERHDAKCGEDNKLCFHNAHANTKMIPKS